MSNPILDKVGDLYHRAVDLTSGAMSAVMAPSKPAATVQDASHHLGTGAVNQAAQQISGRQKQIDDAVDAIAQ